MEDFRETVINLINDLEKTEKGRCIFTCQNEETQGYRTFKIAKGEFAGGALVVSLLTGDDNESAYTSFGFLDPVTKDVRMWKRFKFESVYKKYARMIRNIFFNMNPNKLKIVHSGKCFRCGRTLTTPESIKSGIGPICESY